jgi:hypothetical protein
MVFLLDPSTMRTRRIFGLADERTDHASRSHRLHHRSQTSLANDRHHSIFSLSKRPFIPPTAGSTQRFVQREAILHPLPKHQSQDTFYLFAGFSRSPPRRLPYTIRAI